MSEDSGSAFAPGWTRTVRITNTSETHPRLVVEMLERDGEGAARIRWIGQFLDAPNPDVLRAFLVYGSTPRV